MKHLLNYIISECETGRHSNSHTFYTHELQSWVYGKKDSELVTPLTRYDLRYYYRTRVCVMAITAFKDILILKVFETANYKYARA
jgi:hypothetical protein